MRGPKDFRRLSAARMEIMDAPEQFLAQVFA